MNYSELEWIADEIEVNNELGMLESPPILFDLSRKAERLTIFYNPLQYLTILTIFYNPYNPYNPYNLLQSLTTSQNLLQFLT